MGADFGLTLRRLLTDLGLTLGRLPLTPLWANFEKLCTDLDSVAPCWADLAPTWDGLRVDLGSTLGRLLDRLEADTSGRLLGKHFLCNLIQFLFRQDFLMTLGWFPLEFTRIPVHFCGIFTGLS